MNTDELIKALASDTRRPVTPLPFVWWSAGGLAIALAAVVFFATLNPRPDISAAAQTPRFVFKVAVMVTLALTAFDLARKLSRPGETWHKAAVCAAAAPVLIALGVIFELAVLPPGTWPAKLIGTNGMACLIFITLIGLGPLAMFLLALRYGAPMNPAGAGAVAGLLAGGIAAGLYAIHCTDDSPLFVATWYTIAILLLAIIGAAAAYRFVRW